MKVEYPFFYRKRGVRYIDEIAKPRMQPITDLEFPYSSVYHYLDVRGDTKGPESNDYMFRTIVKPIYIEHVFDLTSEQGGPRKVMVNAAGFQRDYANQNRRTRLMRNFLSVDKSRDTLVAINYAPLASVAKYMRNQYSEHNRWCNVFATAMDKINAMSEVSFRQHFLFCQAPRLIPSLSKLELAATEFNQTAVVAFKTEESYLLLELWKWLGDRPETSVFSRLRLDKIHLVNLVFRESAEWTVINLGQLWAYKKPAEASTELVDGVPPPVPVIQSKQHLNTQQIQRRILRMMITLMEVRSVAAPLDEVVKKTINSKLVQRIQDDGEEPESPDDNDEENALSSPIPVDEPVSADPVVFSDDEDDDGDDDVVDSQKAIDDEDRQLDEDLASLNEIVRRQDEEEESTEKPLESLMSNDESIDYAAGVKKITERLADDGNLSAGEYKRFIRLADGYKEMVAPDGKTTLDEFVDIKYEDLKVQKEINIPDSATIFDKSMLSSSLMDFDRRYVKEIMPRHIASMAMAVQGAGVAITEYSVVNVADAMGAYQDVTIGVSPVIGRSSVLRAKIPLVDADGVFTANGTKYRMRKKRGD